MRRRSGSRFSRPFSIQCVKTFAYENMEEPTLLLLLLRVSEEVQAGVLLVELGDPLVVQDHGAALPVEVEGVVSGPNVNDIFLLRPRDGENLLAVADDLGLAVELGVDVLLGTAADGARTLGALERRPEASGG